MRRWFLVAVDLRAIAGLTHLIETDSGGRFFDGRDPQRAWQAVAIREDSGKRWDLAKVAEAARLRRAGLSERRIAARLGMARSTYQDMRDRMDAVGFSVERFTVEDLAAVAVGRKPGPRPSS